MGLNSKATLAYQWHAPSGRGRNQSDPVADKSPSSRYFNELKAYLKCSPMLIIGIKSSFLIEL